MVTNFSELEFQFLRLTNAGSNIVLFDKKGEWIKKNASNLVTNGYSFVNIEESLDSYDTDNDYIAMERALQIGSGFRGGSKIYIVNSWNSRLDCIVNLNCGYVLRVNRMWDGTNTFGRYFHSLEWPSLALINRIDNSRNEYFGHRIRDSIMRFCIRRRLTYVGFGDEHESVDSAVLTKCRCRHYGDIGTYPEGKTSNISTHPVVIYWLQELLEMLKISRDETFIVHVGSGSMNSLGMESIGLVSKVTNLQYKLAIVDPPWGGYDYWFSSCNKIDVSGPRLGIRRIIPRWGPEPEEFTSLDPIIEVSGRALDYGSGEGDFKFIADEITRYDINNKNSGKIFGLYDGVIIRHVLHHVKNLRILFQYLSKFMKAGTTIWIKDHDVTDSSLAYWLKKYHSTFVKWNNYYEEYFSFFDLIEFMKEVGFDFISESIIRKGFNSGWLKFKFNRRVVLPATPLMEIFSKKMICKLPFNYDMTIPKGTIRMAVPAFYLYFIRMTEDLDIIKSWSRWPVEIWDGLSWGEFSRGRLPELDDIYKFIRKVPNNDFMKIESWRDDLLVGLWSVSNTKNDKPLKFIDKLIEKIKIEKSSFIMLFPRNTQANFHGLKEGKDMMIEGKFKDWVIEPEQFLNKDVVVMSLQRLLIMVERDKKGNVIDKITEREYFDNNHPLMHRWFAVVSTDLFDMRFETMQSQQPIGIKLAGQVIREWSKSDKAWQYIYRKYVLSNWLDCKILYTTTMDGIYKGINIITSGHIINMLFTSKIRVVDWKVYMDTIENNILIRENTKVRNDYMNLFKLNIITETYRDLPLGSWHNYYDIMNGVATYMWLSRKFKSRINVRAVLYIGSRCKELSKKYKTFVYQYPEAELRNVRR